MLQRINGCRNDNKSLCYNRPQAEFTLGGKLMSTPALPAESAPALSEGQRLLYTFTAPTRTMADLRRNASWWVPWLLVSIFSIAFSYTVDKKIGWGQVMETQIQSNPKTAEKMEKVPADQREKIMKMQVTGARVAGYASPVITLLMLAIIAIVLLGVFNFGFGTKLRFNDLMGVTAYSFLPSIFNTLLTILVMFFVEADQFDIKSPLATNPGYFVPTSMPFLKGVLGAFDVFTIWQLFLLAVGVSQLSKVKKRSAFITLFVLVVLFKVVTSALGSM
jgi:hypothetical protein